ncbi:hypothetical protein [Pantoea anthophila]|uniref:hypothetical protein n=1 Tax=Pantoea anthophila TaxID=470931 RepID=UPI003322278F
MLYREAAVRISQTVLMLARELGMSVGQMFEYQKDGKVTAEEASTHMHKVQVVLESLYSEILDPIAVDYPDLRPECCACGGCEDDEEKKG